MAIKVERKALIRTLQVANRVRHSMVPHMPALCGVHIETTADCSELLVSATDCDLWLEQTLPVLNAREKEATDFLLFDVGAVCRALQQLGGAEVEINWVPSGAGHLELEITSGDLSIKPGWAEGTGAHTPPDLHKSAGKAILCNVPESLRRVSGAISRDECRFYLNGAFLTEADGRWRLVATDGHRLYCNAFDKLSSAPGGFDFGARRGVIIPHMAVNALAWLCARAGVHDVEVQLAYTQSAASNGHCPDNPLFSTFKVGAFTLYARLIDYDYPEYEKLLPKEAVEELLVSRGKLASAVDGMTARPGWHIPIKLHCTGEEIDLSYTDKSSESEDYLRLAACVPAQGDAERIVGVNPRYLKAALAALPRGCKQVRFGFQAAGEEDADGKSMSPFSISDPDCRDLTIIQMPMRL